MQVLSLSLLFVFVPLAGVLVTVHENFCAMAVLEIVGVDVPSVNALWIVWKHYFLDLL